MSTTRPLPLHPSSSLALMLLLLISLVHFCFTGKSCTAGAVRLFPPAAAAGLGAVVVKEERPLAVVPLEAAEAANPRPPPIPLNHKRNQTEIFKEYFKSRISDVSTTTDDTFHDYKRRIPSCPDPLHN